MNEEILKFIIVAIYRLKICRTNIIDRRKKRTLSFEDISIYLKKKKNFNITSNEIENILLNKLHILNDYEIRNNYKYFELNKTNLFYYMKLFNIKK